MSTNDGPTVASVEESVKRLGHLNDQLGAVVVRLDGINERLRWARPGVPTGACPAASGLCGQLDDGLRLAEGRAVEMFDLLCLIEEALVAGAAPPVDPNVKLPTPLTRTVTCAPSPYTNSAQRAVR